MAVHLRKVKWTLDEFTYSFDIMVKLLTATCLLVHDSLQTSQNQYQRTGFAAGELAWQAAVNRVSGKRRTRRRSSTRPPRVSVDRNW